MDKISKENQLLSSIKACNPNLSFVVEACAGSGKTWLICSRILRFLVEGGRPSAVLALTFTNKAASEMQNRLNQFLFFLATEPDEKVLGMLLSLGVDKTEIESAFPKARSLYESILVGVDQPNICTFHSWYSGILRMSPLQLGIYSHIGLASSPKEFQDKVWRMFLETQKINAINEDSEFMLLVDSIGLLSIKTALCSLMSIRVEIENIVKNKNLDSKKESIKQSIETCHSKKKMWCVKNFNEANFLFHCYKVIENREMFTELLLDIKPDSLINIAEILLRKDRTSLAYQFIRKKDEIIWGEKGGEIKQRTTIFANSLVVLLNECQILMQKARDSVLFDLSKIFFSCLDEYVFEKQETDYSGLEYLAWKNISGEYGAYVQSRLDFKYDQILIDEFQDTSSSQWKILKHWLNSYIISELGADSSSPKLFVVGDPKQSIYRFRGADPKVFYKAREWLEKKFYAGKLETDKTRRCSKEIVKFMNDLFMNQESFSYRKHDGFNNIKGKVYRLPTVKKQNNAFNDSKDRNWLFDPLGGKESELWKIEGTQIGEALIKIKTSLKDFSWSDVRILVRSRIHSKDISESLTKLGIPNTSDSNLNLLEQQEIIDLVSLLRFLIDDTSDYDFVIVAKSNVFGIQDEELVWLKNVCNHQKTKISLWKSLNISVDEDLNTISKNLVNFSESIKVFKEKLEFMPVHDFLQYIVSSTSLVEKLKIHLDRYRFSKAISNIEKFIEFSLDLDFGKFPSLAKFLQQVSQAAEFKDSEGLKVEHVDEFEAISLQTLHSAKGLESRVVVLAGMSDLENYDKEGIKWVYSFDQELESIVEMSTFRSGDLLDKKQEQILNYEKKLMEEEKLNLLYVGVTRAKEILVLSAVEHKQSKESWYDLVADCSEEFDFKAKH